MSIEDSVCVCGCGCGCECVCLVVYGVFIVYLQKTLKFYNKGHYSMWDFNILWGKGFITLLRVWCCWVVVEKYTRGFIV